MDEVRPDLGMGTLFLSLGSEGGYAVRDGGFF